MQAMLAREKEERARIVVTLRETIAAMKQASQVEDDLRQEVADLQEQLAGSQSAEVGLSVIWPTRPLKLPAWCSALLWR